MSGPDEARAMLTVAQHDFAAIEALCDMPAIATEIVGFHAQQAVEKALKAWIAWTGRDFPYTHNLVALFNLLEEAGCDVERFKPLVQYDAFAVQFRYTPMDLPDVELDRAEAVREVRKLLDHVQRVMGQGS